MSKKKKTIIICTSPKGNSVSNYFFGLAETFHEKGYAVIVIVDKKKANTSISRNFTVLSWPSYRPTTFKDFVFFYKLCKRHKPIFTLGQFGATNFVLFISYMLSVPKRGVYWHTMLKQLRTDSKLSRLKFLLFKWRKQLLLKCCANVVLTNSKNTKKDLIKHFRITSKKIYVFNILIQDYFKDNNINYYENREQAIVFIGRLHKSKGHDLVLKQMQDLVKIYSDIKLYIIGNGPERHNLIELTKSLGLANNVIFTGAIPQTQTYEHLNRVFLHISASLEEAYGLVNIEALSAGTPIVATRVGGLQEILIEGINGFYFNPNEVESLLKTFRKLQKLNWQKFSANARQDFLHRFSLSRTNLHKHYLMLDKIINN
ncbi:glycosyltransferase family 4 protein [Aestuariivivens marinum]|uniref:glycosyltransferase family 4 protein n=1 Tax=Aestuariivivens marinum TaxID=2913555 RepID=UPI001F56EA04|nr:glycosyltransferase family 4 protein [Aestuariivivens marinum]